MSRDGLTRAVADSETVMLGPNRVAFLLGGTDTAGAFSLTEFVMAPPPAPGPPLHVHTVEEETIYLLDGQLSVTLRERITDCPTAPSRTSRKVYRTRWSTSARAARGC